MPDYDVFLSYNWHDHEVVEGVARELSARQLRVFLDRWYLKPGQSWRRELEDKLEESAGAVIFLGSSGLGSWQERELDVALDRQARSDDFLVIPVLLPGADPALGFLAMNTWVDVRDGVQGPAIDALDAAIRGRPGGPDSRSTATLLANDVAPYRGLRPFREEDADFFYGREAFTETLADTVSDQTFVAVVGPSGSGKSSVVRAGLVPRLRRSKDGTVWEIATLVPGQRPLHALAAALISLLEPELTERFVEVARLAEGLASGTIEFADIVARVLEQQPGTDRLLLVVDQWEELYTLTTDAAAQRSFIDALLVATEGSSRLTVVLTLRGDFVGTALGYRPLSDRLQGAQVNLSTMTAEETERAMTEPARKVGLEFEPGLVKRVLDDIGDEPGTLPLLEFVLTELWRDRARGRLLHSTYEAIGGVRGAMAARAEEVVGGLSEADQERVRRLLLHLVQPGTGTTDTRRRATLEEIGTEAEPIVRKLAGTRLLVTGRDEITGEETVEVAHEALIQHWGRLRDWVDRDREFLMWRRRVESAVQEWEATGRDEGSLLHGVALGEAERWHEERGQDLGLVEREFVEKSVALREAEVARTRRRQRLLAAAAAVMIAVVSVLAVVALFARQSAQSAQSDAESAQSDAESALVVSEARELAARANSATSPQLSLLLAAEAYSRSPLLESRDALARGLSAWKAAALIPFDEPLKHTGQVTSVMFSPDGATVASADDDGTVRLWDVVTSRSIGDPFEHGFNVNSVAFSPDGATIASAGMPFIGVRLWDVASGRRLGQLRGHTGTINSVAFSPDGVTLASASGDGTVMLWDVATREPHGSPLEHPSGVLGVAFSPDGTTLASAGSDNEVRLWDVATGEPLGDPLTGHTDSVRSVAFSPDGEKLASGSRDGTVKLWNPATGQLLGAQLIGQGAFDAAAATFAGVDVRVESVAFSPDGETLASGHSEGTIRLWAVPTRRLLGTLRGHNGSVNEVTFSPDGDTFASAGDDDLVRLWKVPIALDRRGDRITDHVESVAFSPDGASFASATDRSVQLLDIDTGDTFVVEHPSGTSVAFSPDGTTLASGGSDNNVRLWDVATGKAYGDPFTAHTDDVRSVAFSPDGERLASGSRDGTVRLWDVATGEPVGDPLRVLLMSNSGSVESVAFSPDGETLASGNGSTVHLWDVATGEPFGSPLTGHTDDVRSVAFSPDGETLASASRDGTVLLWNAAGPGGYVGRNYLHLLRGHNGSVNEVTFSPDGEILASAGSDNEVRLWDVATGEPLGDPFTGHSDFVQSVAFSPDGEKLASGSWDGTVRLWEIPTLEVACALAISMPLPSVPRFLQVRTRHWACEELVTDGA